MKDENDGVTSEIQLKSYVGYARVSTAEQNLDLQIVSFAENWVFKNIHRHSQWC